MIRQIQQIEEALARAAMQVQLNARRKQMYSLGNLFDSNRTEFLYSVSGDIVLKHLVKLCDYRTDP